MAVPPDDPAAFVAAVRALVDDPATPPGWAARPRLGRAGVTGSGRRRLRGARPLAPSPAAGPSVGSGRCTPSCWWAGSAPACARSPTPCRSRCCRSATSRSSSGSSRTSGAAASTDVTLALGFLPEPFLEAFPDGRCGGVALRYAVEPEPLDTAGAIRFAAASAGIDDTFVVANGDVLTDLDVAALVAAHRGAAPRPPCTSRGVDDPSAFGVVELDGDGRVGSFLEKPAPGTDAEQPDQRRHLRARAGVIDRIAAGRRGVDRA